MDDIARNLYQALSVDKKKLIKLIAHDYDLNEEELLQKYLYIDNIESSCSMQSKKIIQKKKRNDCIETEEYTYNGITYLIDSKNQVYTYNIDKPMLIGDKLVNGSIKFIPEYLKMIREGR